jgi:hypothetical protein
MRVLCAQRLRLGWAMPRRLTEVVSVKMEANTHCPVDTLPRRGRVPVPSWKRSAFCCRAIKAIYRTHRTKPARKPANGAAVSIMPLPGRMSSSQPEFRKRFLQLRLCWSGRHEGSATRGQPQSVYAKHSKPAGFIGAVFSVPRSWRLSPAARMGLGAASAESNKANPVQVEPPVRKEGDAMGC